MNPSKAAFALILVGAAAHAQETAKPHAFFDRTNLALFSADALVRSLDAQSTRKVLTDPCKCFVETSLPPEIVQSTPRMYGYSIGVAAAVMGGAYLAHRTHHHRIERLIPMLDIVYDGRLAINNYRLSAPAQAPASHLPSRSAK